MSMLCATHPGVDASGTCDTCGKPYCAACVVEDVAREAAFCSEVCRGMPASESPGAAVGRSNEELITALESPIRNGWALASSLIGPLLLWVAIPVALAYSVMETAVFRLVEDADTSVMAMLLAQALSAALALPAAAVLLSRAHAKGEHGNPWPHVLPRFVPWLLTMLAFAAASVVGSLLLVVPGIIVGIRLFWADEFALVHGHGPGSALRASWDLTRGLTGRVFVFQFLLGLAEYLVLIPVVMGMVVVETFAAPATLGVASSVVTNLLFAALLVVGYASAHAAEVVYFYGLRALRAEVPAASAGPDWAAHALREYQSDAGAAASHPTCPTCGTPWDPDAYRDVEAIYCSACRTPLTRPV